MCFGDIKTPLPDDNEELNVWLHLRDFVFLQRLTASGRTPNSCAWVFPHADLLNKAIVGLGLFIYRQDYVTALSINSPTLNHATKEEDMSSRHSGNSAFLSHRAIR
jgi:hypothetical protein